MSSELDLETARSLAARVAARAELIDVRLFGSQVGFRRLPDPSRQLSWSLEIEPAPEFEPGAANFVIHCDYTLTVREVGTGSAAPVDDDDEILEMTFRYGALYQVELRDGDEPVREDEMRGFAIATGAFALYPYARGYIHDVTGRLGLPVLTIGVYRVPVAAPQATSKPRRTGKKEPSARAARTETEVKKSGTRKVSGRKEPPARRA